MKELEENTIEQIRTLLNFFGSARAVSQARADELTSVDGVSINMANKIFDWFNE